MLPAVPPLGIESTKVLQIAAELEKLADGLRTYPPGTGGSRTAAPAEAIVRSLQKINATLADGARRGSLGSAGFTTIGREFGKIGTTLQTVGSAPKTTAKTTTTKKATRKTTRR